MSLPTVRYVASSEHVDGLLDGVPLLDVLDDIHPHEEGADNALAWRRLLSVDPADRDALLADVVELLRTTTLRDSDHSFPTNHGVRACRRAERRGDLDAYHAAQRARFHILVGGGAP